MRRLRENGLYSLWYRAARAVAASLVLFLFGNCCLVQASRSWAISWNIFTDNESKMVITIIFAVGVLFSVLYYQFDSNPEDNRWFFKKHSRIGDNLQCVLAAVMSGFVFGLYSFGCFGAFPLKENVFKAHRLNVSQNPGVDCFAHAENLTKCALSLSESQLRTEYGMPDVQTTEPGTANQEWIYNLDCFSLVLTLNEHKVTNATYRLRMGG